MAYLFPWGGSLCSHYLLSLGYKDPIGMPCYSPAEGPTINNLTSGIVNTETCQNHPLKYVPLGLPSLR